MTTCITGKKTYPSPEIAEEALIGAWVTFDFRAGTGPVAVYQCEDCGYYHLTSKGEMNEKLAHHIAEGKIRRLKEADQWSKKFRK